MNLDRRLHASSDDCIDLLQGLLPERSERVLLEHLGDCSECETRFRLLLAERERVRANYRLVRAEDRKLVLERRLSGVDAPLDTTGTPSTGQPTGLWGALRHRYYAVGALAIAAAAIIVFLVLPRAPSDPWHASLRALPAISEELSLRDVDPSTADPAFLKGLAEYAEGRYGEASRALESSTVTGRYATVRDVYLGSAQTHQGRAEEALRTLRRVNRERLPDPWRTEAQWTYCVALAKAGKTASADSLVRAWRERDDELGERANEISPPGSSTR